MQLIKKEKEKITWR